MARKDINSVLDKLEVLKGALEENRNSKQRLEGKRESKMEALSKLGFMSISAGEKKINALVAEQKKLEEKLGTLVEKFEEKFPQLMVEE